MPGSRSRTLSAYDPPVEGEGSLDPMGLAAISDRLVPGVRARMQRVRFVTAMAVGAMACETLADEPSADGISTPAICFEWLVIEGLVRRLSPQEIPPGVPGSQKARVVVNRKQRLSAATYLGPVGVRVSEQGFAGFTDAVPGTNGGRLRAQLREQVRDALRAGRCTTHPAIQPPAPGPDIVATWPCGWSYGWVTLGGKSVQTGRWKQCD